MTQSTTIDLGHVARDLNLPPDRVQRTIELLDEGNTVPFITRYRKDQTGGFDEEQIREIQFRVGKIRQLADRKATILKTIEAQGQLTPELAEQIQHASTPKRLEDLYLPFKPKKQTLATIAREKGLEPLAREIFEAHETAADIQARAAAFLSPEKEVNSVEEVLTGVGHLMAERFSENAELRGRLRRIFQRSGKIVCTKVETPPPVTAAAASAPAAGEGGQVGEGAAEESQKSEAGGQETVASGAQPLAESAGQETAASPADDSVLSTESSASGTDTPPKEPSDVSAPESPLPATNSASEGDAQANRQSETSSPQSTSSPLPSPASTSEPLADASSEPRVESATGPLPTGRLFEAPAAPVLAPVLTKKKKKKKKKVVGEHAFKDYYDYREPLSRVPPHRVLAINRGERAHAIRVKIEADFEAMFREAEQFLLGHNHPHAVFIRGAIRDSLTRLMIPSLERELRRELTERAEEHAVEVFVRNLRKLLLQPPIRGRRVLAVDPGFKSGSKMAALDEFGNVLGHGMIFVIGKDEEKRKKARTRLADMVKHHDISVIAIGNGTGCRETEQLVADCLADELKDRDVSYVIVNEAGASIYSTSPLGREELPQYDALQRGAISIGRRLLDPLSEMVKIHPANLGVGLYQHDIKAKHLKDSLDSVVESCVNFVGVDVNSASPALLRYVSGMNALTARRVYEHRREKGPFKNREELKQVPGFGDQTFVQSAGFLKVTGGENPLDATWIHPESYDIAGRVLEKIGCDVSELAKVVPAPPKEEAKKEFAAELHERESAARSLGSTAAGQEEVVKAAPEAPLAAVVDAVLSTEYAVPSPASESTGIAVSSVSAETPTTEPPPAPDSPADASLSPTPVPEVQNPKSEIQNSPARNLIADRAATVDVRQLASELNIGTHLLEDILASLTRPALDPRDNLSPPVFRRGIIKLEDLLPGMELSGTVLNVVDFGVFVDIGLSDSGLVHISRLADRFIRDPHEVVGVGDVLKVWVVDVDKSRRRVSLTAIAPGSERPQRPPRERHDRQQRPPRPPRRPQGESLPAHGGAPPPPHVPVSPTGSGPPQGQRPPRPHGGGRRDQRRGGRPPESHPKTIERPPTKPKVIKPITKKMEQGKEPMRSFSDLMQLMDKKKQKPKPEEPPPPAAEPAGE